MHDSIELNNSIYYAHFMRAFLFSERSAPTITKGQKVTPPVSPRIVTSFEREYYSVVACADDLKYNNVGLLQFF